MTSTLKNNEDSDSSSFCGKKFINGASKNASILQYENENFFETMNDKLIEIKNIFDNKLFWERINAFFDIKLFQFDLEMIKGFYNLNQEQIERLK